jgi:hypothetical protein
MTTMKVEVCKTTTPGKTVTLYTAENDADRAWLKARGIGENGGIGAPHPEIPDDSDYDDFDEPPTRGARGQPLNWVGQLQAVVASGRMPSAAEIDRIVGASGAKEVSTGAVYMLTIVLGGPLHAALEKYGVEVVDDGNIYR